MTKKNWAKSSERIIFQSIYKKKFPKNILQMLPTDLTCNFWANGNLCEKGNV
jgi:hypothetical protein